MSQKNKPQKPNYNKDLEKKILRSSFITVGIMLMCLNGIFTLDHDELFFFIMLTALSTFVIRFVYKITTEVIFDD